MQAKMEYFQITHNNTLETTTEETLSKLFVNLSATLIAISEEEVGKEINSFFDTLIKGNSTWDLFQINYTKTSDYFNKHHFKLEEYQYIFNDILSTFNAFFITIHHLSCNIFIVILFHHHLVSIFAKCMI